MSRILYFVSVALMMTYAASAISEQCNEAEKNVTKYCQDNPYLGSVGAFNECQHYEMKRADCNLNAEYKKLIAFLKKDKVYESALSKLILAQKSWITFRDQNCIAQDNIFRKKDIDTDCPACINSGCLTQLTEARTAQLKVLTTCLENNDCSYDPW